MPASRKPQQPPDLCQAKQPLPVAIERQVFGETPRQIPPPPFQGASHIFRHVNRQRHSASIMQYLHPPVFETGEFRGCRLSDAKFGRTALSRSYDDLYIVP